MNKTQDLGCAVMYTREIPMYTFSQYWYRKIKPRAMTEGDLYSPQSKSVGGG